MLPQFPLQLIDRHLTGVADHRIVKFNAGQFTSTVLSDVYIAITACDIKWLVQGAANFIDINWIV